MLQKYAQFIRSGLNEALRNLSTPEILQWLETRSDHTFVALDTETTGLRGPWKEQLTQIAAVAFRYDPSTLTFNEIGAYNEKCRLTPDILAQMKEPGSRIKDVLRYTRYGVSRGKFSDEQLVIQRLFEFIGGFDKVVLLIQNAPFDMPMINVRSHKGALDREIFDTKDFFAYYLLPTLQALAPNNAEASDILKAIGTTSSGKLPTSSLPKVAGGLGIDAAKAHDALFDCRYMVKVLERALEIVSANPYINRKEWVRPRISMDRYLKMKNKSRR